MPSARHKGEKSQPDGFHLLLREPHLADAAELELALAGLYAGYAASAPDDALRWSEAARLSTEFAQVLERVVASCRPFRHHPRPTRIRVNLLCERALGQIRQAIDTLGGVPMPPGPQHPAWGALHRLEQGDVVAPLLRCLQVAPSGIGLKARRILMQRNQVLGELGVPGLEPIPQASPRQRTEVGEGTSRPPASQTVRVPEWETEASVERINRPRRCATARTQDGRTVFFGAKTVSGGMMQLQVGDPVTMTLRKGPLGLTAVRVEPVAQVAGHTGSERD